MKAGCGRIERRQRAFIAAVVYTVSCLSGLVPILTASAGQENNKGAGKRRSSLRVRRDDGLRPSTSPTILSDLPTYSVFLKTQHLPYRIDACPVLIS